ncbi:hypothetical protein EX30DRAFT_371002 [Ascodesmis nigricans]|uniref:Rad60/SUMO-like domain-containing protein n=1 Tax=Ascodesmis nigricans TaxID=341454 RepID=A0A4S2MYE6_9PEZI|nr:hypothetical protein EX30DRAFT_371002 [Ascodesmis nigricans]
MEDNKAGIKDEIPDKVSIVVRSQGYGELAFNVKTSHKLSKLTSRWCQHNGLDPKTVRFLTEEGQRLNPEDFIKDLDLDLEMDEEDGLMKGYINAHMEQIGGC